MYTEDSLPSKEYNTHTREQMQERNLWQVHKINDPWYGDTEVYNIYVTCMVVKTMLMFVRNTLPSVPSAIEKKKKEQSTFKGHE